MPILLRVPFGGGQRPLDPSKLSPTLGENSWKTIIRASEEGIASQVWSVGDEVDIMLSGDYTGSITMQIAGFDHDNMVNGGKAGITFLSKHVLGATVIHPDRSNPDWVKTALYNTGLPKIKASLPVIVQGSIKKVFKTCANKVYSSRNHTTQDDIFIPAVSEIVPLGDTRIEYQERAVDEGTLYKMFETSSAITKTDQAGGTSKWWTRSSYADNFMYVETYEAIRYSTVTSKYGICFGFCI